MTKLDILYLELKTIGIFLYWAKFIILVARKLDLMVYESDRMSVSIFLFYAAKASSIGFTPYKYSVFGMVFDIFDRKYLICTLENIILICDYILTVPKENLWQSILKRSHKIGKVRLT